MNLMKLAPNNYKCNDLDQFQAK